MKKVVIHQPNFLPYLGFFEQINEADIYVAYDDVQFTENEFQNRNSVKSQKGKDNLTLPVLKKGRLGQLINQVEISDPKFSKKIINKLESCYRRAPCWGEVLEPVSDVLNQGAERMVDVNLPLLHLVCNKLGLEYEYYLSSDLAIEYEGRLDRVFNIMAAVGAQTLVAGPGAATYMNSEDFKARGLRLEICTFEPIPYPQLHGEFIPYLSIVDYLMNVGWKFWK